MLQVILKFWNHFTQKAIKSVMDEKLNKTNKTLMVALLMYYFVISNKIKNMYMGCQVTILFKEGSDGFVPF